MKKEINSYQNLLELIGDTPLIKLNKVTKSFNGKFYAKVEAFNPGHSNKDRIALFIIEEAEKKGLLNKNTTIIETTSGNTGFSLAMISMVKGYKCILAVSSKSSEDKINMLKAMGAKVYVCPSNVEHEDPRSYYKVAEKIHKETENSIYINQYFNDLNILAHYNSTGPEIWNQTKGKITHLIAASGTGGTISGIARFLKEKNNNIKIIGVDAYGSVIKKFHETKEFDKNEIYPYTIEGLGKNLIPSSTDFDVINKFVKVTDKDSAICAREISRNEGLFVGYTSGAVFQAIKQLNNDGLFNQDSIVVLVFPDHGSRYMTKIYNDHWMVKQGFLDNKKNKDSDAIQYIN
ncbi:MAG: cysteine synthase family protein [Flavobacteriaceae bacterium]|nr:cysteine synthase family protein [Flavobacteriaceae bacterium]